VLPDEDALISASSPSPPPTGSSFLMPPDDARTDTSGARAEPPRLRPAGDGREGGAGRVGVRHGPPALRLLRVHMSLVKRLVCLGRDGTGRDPGVGACGRGRRREKRSGTAGTSTKAIGWSDAWRACVATAEGGIHDRKCLSSPWKRYVSTDGHALADSANEPVSYFPLLGYPHGCSHVTPHYFKNHI
jgi:hypothetical protein